MGSFVGTTLAVAFGVALGMFLYSKVSGGRA